MMLTMNARFLAVIFVVGIATGAAVDMDDMASMYGQRAEDSCTAAIKTGKCMASQWCMPACRTFHSVVEEFFNMKSTPIAKALKRAGHDKREPLNHFENFETGLDKVIADSTKYIASACIDDGWDTFEVVIKKIADSFQVGWIKWIANEVFQGDKKFAKALEIGEWDFKLQDENDDYIAEDDASGVVHTGKNRVRVGSTRL